jgi:type IV pilus assembly protein PilM
LVAVDSAYGMINAMGLMNTNEEYVGMDISTSFVRVVQLKREGTGNPALVTYGQAAFPDGLTMTDSVIDQDKIAAVISGLMKELKITASQVVTGIPSVDAFATVIQTPKLNPADLAKAMKLQADQYIPMAIDQVKMDWQGVGAGKTPDQMKVLLVAAPNGVVNKYLAIVEKAGLQLNSLELNAIAQARSLMPKSDVAAVIVNIGDLSTEINIIQERAPQLIRSVTIGGQTLIRAVSQSLGLDEAQADQFLNKFGLTQTKLEGQVAKAIKPSLDTLVTEINSSIKYFMAENPGSKIEKLIISGQTATLPELSTYFANSSGLPVEMANPWQNISYPATEQDRLRQNALAYGVAAGLALRSYV